MSNTSSSHDFKNVEVIPSVQRRRRWSVAEKLQVVEESALKKGGQIFILDCGYRTSRIKI